MIAVCLLTCGRVSLTARTASSFIEWNRGRKDMVLLHCEGLPFADEAAYHARCIAKAHGFRTISPSSAERVSQMHSLRTFMTEVASIGAEFVLWLENDWVSVAPVPDLGFFQETASAGVVTWRLFGKRKMKGDGPRAMAGTHQIGTGTLIKWRRSTCIGWQVGEAHWAGGGSVVRAEHLRKHLDLARLKDVIVAEPALTSLRLARNLMFSIGHETTPGFMG